ncbi:MIP/aquaporin family protein [Flexithrix dorotheae]|uniref:MIP/aquaporin family protein n=1 Tax=Flexithrix dorotheae TaxID=70993 RepID=UPI0003607A88|nr:MIP/aquaporin family protein [Flexithrix dorotheae]
MTPFIAEILGTFILVLLGVGVNANMTLKGTYGNNGGWIVTSFGWGLSVFCGVIVAGPYSGAHLNPAVTIGLATSGLFEWKEVFPFIVAQMIGAMLGAALMWLNFKNHFNATEGDKLGVFSTGPAIKDLPINFICELTGTFVLVFVILYITGPEISASGLEDAKVGLGSLGALPVAFLVVVIGMSLGGTTGYAINPARDLGPRIMHAILPIEGKGSSNWAYSWVPVLAPITGAVGASFLYLFIS